MAGGPLFRNTSHVWLAAGWRRRVGGPYEWHLNSRDDSDTICICRQLFEVSNVFCDTDKNCICHTLLMSFVFRHCHGEEGRQSYTWSLFHYGRSRSVTVVHTRGKFRPSIAFMGNQGTSTTQPRCQLDTPHVSGCGVARRMFPRKHSYLIRIYKFLTLLYHRPCANQHGRLFLSALLPAGGAYNGSWLTALCPCPRHP